MRHPQAFCQQQLQFVAQPLAPMAQVRAFVRKLVLEKLLSGEVLKIRVMHPALADTLVGQSVDVLEQQQPNHEPGLNPRPALVAVERSDLVSIHCHSILPASSTSSCFMLMICSSRARNRSPDPVVSCFFGRIAPSDAATESRLLIRENL